MIAGVIRNIRQHSLWEESEPMLYLPSIRSYSPDVTFHVQVEGDPLALSSLIRSEIRRIDPNVPVYSIQRLSDQETAAVAPQRMAAVMLGLSGVLALVLALVGIAGVMAYSVSCRRQEIGIRMALGARQVDVFRMISSQGMMHVVAGLFVGLAAALGLTRFLAGILHGISPTDSVTFAVCALATAVIAFLAGSVPALKAARIDPLKALRHE